MEPAKNPKPLSEWKPGDPLPQEALDMLAEPKPRTPEENERVMRNIAICGLAFNIIVLLVVIVLHYTKC